MTDYEQLYFKALGDIARERTARQLVEAKSKRLQREVEGLEKTWLFKAVFWAERILTGKR